MIRVHNGKRCPFLERELADRIDQKIIYVERHARCFASTVLFIFVLHISAWRSKSAWKNRLLVSSDRCAG